MCDVADGHGNGQREADGPQVERQVAVGGQPFGESGKVATQDDGEKERAEEQGEYPVDDEQKGLKERLVGMGVDKRYQSRYEHGCGEVDDDGVGHQCACITAQFAGDDGCRRSRGAYHTDHTPFDDDAQMGVRKEMQQQCTCRKGAALQE